MANVPCAGCSEFFTEPTTYFDCKHGDASPDYRKCVTSFDAIAIADLVDKRQTDPKHRTKPASYCGSKDVNHWLLTSAGAIL
jgi:hypothetical protein